MASPVSRTSENDFRLAWKTNKENAAKSQEKVFSSMLQLSVNEGVKAALGQAILGILTDQGLFNNLTDPKEFHRKLQTVFGNGATVIEKIIIKDLFRKLSLSYASQDAFNYGDDLERARQACSQGTPST
jgi:hypothetical protein